ncbi:hypothetical protein CXB49_13005 [Chromobacterium sp. ATCC 53434]|uniref:hypothetical protein n=1 Tax=Chromobacterium TaxID=535 RepID=UPI000C781BCD|nr:hypothetical protein [Chromobacterium sp. ATCC 53434]AUH51667.1 hypothetical protein CXB49_13005 [Chromobacterium sp. ATCC 53434]
MNSFAKLCRGVWIAIIALGALPAAAAPLLSESGPRAAAALSQRYNQVVDSCNGGEYAAPACAGVLLRPAGAAGLPSWLPGAEESRMRGVGVLYLRRDLHLSELSYGVALPSLADIGQASGLTSACVWPYAVSVSKARNDYGCGTLAAEPTQTAASDSSSCNGIGVRDGKQWLRCYKGEDSQQQPCSLSALVAGRFADALHINSHGAGQRAPQLWFRGWPAAAKLPVAAFVYFSASGKVAAIDDRDEFAAETGHLLPVLAFDKGASQAFVFNRQDNPEGERSGSRGDRVAARLQRRFDDVSAHCPGGGPAWQCSGLIMRATAGHPFTVPPNNPVASFSYLRKDAGSQNLFKSQGIVLKPVLGLGATMACLYPMDADSVNAHGRVPEHYYCNIPSLTPYQASDGDYSSCHAAGVANSSLSGNEMADRFHAKYDRDVAAQCSFSTRDAAQFYAGILATAYNHKMFDRMDWNELLLKPWGGEAAVPEIEAFFYFQGDAGAKNLARGYVDQYKKLTGKDAPAVAVDFAHDRIAYEP